MVSGRAGEVGLDGMLRVELAPLDLSSARELTGRRRAEVLTSRGDSIGRVESLVGTLERPVAVVKVHPDRRKAVSQLRGREVFLG